MPDALVAAAKSSLADRFPSEISGRSLANAAGVNYGQLHRYFPSKTAVLAAAFDALLWDYAVGGTDVDGVPAPFRFHDHPTFWRAIAHVMLDRATFADFQPSADVLATAATGVQGRRTDLDRDQAKAVVALGISVEFGLMTHRKVLGRAAGLSDHEPAVDSLVRQWLGGLYSGTGPLGAAPVASPNLPERSSDAADRVRGAWQAEAGGERSVEERLVAAGADLLEEYAPSAISGRQLARAAGVNYGLIHHHFGTKHDVLVRSVQRHRDRFFAAYADERRAPGYFTACEHPGYVRALTWAAIDEGLSSAEQRFPVIDMLIAQRRALDQTAAEALVTRVAVFTAVSTQMAWALLGDVFERALDAELVRLERLVAPLLHRLLQAPLLETELPT